MKKGITITLSVVFIVFLGYWGLFLYFVSKSPLTYEELDLNENGNVSFFEVEYASSYGRRKIHKDGKECIEYYAQKDGLTLKVECNG